MKGKASIAIGEICTEFSRSCKSNEGPVKFTCYLSLDLLTCKKISSFPGSDCVSTSFGYILKILIFIIVVSYDYSHAYDQFKSTNLKFNYCFNSNIKTR